MRKAKTDLEDIAADETEDLKNCCCGIGVVWIIMGVVLPALLPGISPEAWTWVEDNSGAWILFMFAFAPLAIFNITQISDLAD